MNYNKKLKAIGDKVAIEVLDKGLEKVVDGIIIPKTASANTSLAKGRVISKGVDVKKNFGIDDIVWFDRLSVFYDTHPIVILKEENIISKEVWLNDKNS